MNKIKIFLAALLALLSNLFLIPTEDFITAVLFTLVIIFLSISLYFFITDRTSNVKFEIFSMLRLLCVVISSLIVIYLATVYIRNGMFQEANSILGIFYVMTINCILLLSIKDYKIKDNIEVLTLAVLLILTISLIIIYVADKSLVFNIIDDITNYNEPIYFISQNYLYFLLITLAYLFRNSFIRKLK